MLKTTMFIPEEGYANRRQLFDDTNYYLWKAKIKLFLVSQDNDMWSIIENRNYVPRTNENDHAFTIKEKASWTVDGKTCNFFLIYITLLWLFFSIICAIWCNSFMHIWFDLVEIYLYNTTFNYFLKIIIL